MTWWYRWLCRLSGVLGAVCEYPARPRAPHPACHREGTRSGCSLRGARGAREAGASVVAMVTGRRPGFRGEERDRPGELPARRGLPAAPPRRRAWLEGSPAC